MVGKCAHADWRCGADSGGGAPPCFTTKLFTCTINWGCTQTVISVGPACSGYQRYIYTHTHLCRLKEGKREDSACTNLEREEIVTMVGAPLVCALLVFEERKGADEGYRVEIMSTPDMRGYSLLSRSLRRLQTVDWKPHSSTLSLQTQIFDQIHPLELSLLT